MAHNFLHTDPAPAGPTLPSDPKALIDRFLDAIWMERGLSENTLGAYRADLIALNQRLTSRSVELARASRADVLRLTFGMGLRWLAYGVAIGLAGSLATTRLLAAELQEVSARDPLTLTLGVAVITASAALASYLPARRATRIDPLIVLRSQ